MIKIEVGHLLFQRKIRQEKKFALRAKQTGILARFWTARGGGGPPLGRIYALEKLGRI